MSCDHVEPLLRDFVDRELSPAAAATVETHLSTCTTCARRAEAERELKLLIRAKVKAGPAPAGLAAAITRSVRVECGAGDADGAPSRSSPRRAVALAAVVAVVTIVAVVSWNAYRSRPLGVGPQHESRFATELADDHVRFLAAEKYCEIETPDPAAAERWFAGRLDAPVALPGFNSAGAALQGGRLCRVLDRRVALLFYIRGNRRFSLFVMNATGLDAEGATLVDPEKARCVGSAAHGCKVFAWKRNGLVYALVADERELGIEDLVADAYRK